MEYLHGVGMLLAVGFACYAVLEGADRRMIMLSDEKRRCAALGLCGRCIKHADVPCGLRRLFCLASAAADDRSRSSCRRPAGRTQPTSRKFSRLPTSTATCGRFRCSRTGFAAARHCCSFAVSLAILLLRKQAGIAPGQDLPGGRSGTAGLRRAANAVGGRLRSESGLVSLLGRGHGTGPGRGRVRRAVDLPPPLAAMDQLILGSRKEVEGRPEQAERSSGKK